MGGGSLQLLLFGQQDIYLKSNPSITFFKKVFKTFSNFAMESIRVDFNGNADTNIYDQTILKVKIPRHADLISQMYLVFDIPEIISDNVLNFRWIPNIGEAIIDNCYITIGGSLVDTQYGEYLHLFNSLNYTADRRDSLNRMSGNVIQLNNPEQFALLTNNLSNPPLRYRIGSAYPIYTPYDPNNPNTYTPSIPTRKIYVPLTFWFNRDVGNALPLVSLQYSEVEVTIVLRPWIQLYKVFYNIGGNQDFYAPNLYIQSHQLSKFVSNVKRNFLVSNTVIDCGCYLEINYIYLDKIERQYFAYKPLDYLIEQVVRVQSKAITATTIVDMVLQNPVKEIIWVLQKSDVNIRNDWFNYLDKSRKIMLSAKIMFNGVDRFNEKESEYFNYLQPYQHHTGNATDGLYVYSFSIEPEKFQPSGCCNMSRVNNIQFYMTCNVPSNNSYTYSATYYVVNYNFLRISSGLCGVVYST
jgi:hypothetical protein